MHRIRVLTVLSCLTSGFILSGCGKDSRPHIDPAADKAPEAEFQKGVDIPSGQTTGTFVPVDRPGTAGTAATAGQSWTALSVPAPDLSAQEKYDAALLEALHLLLDRKYPQALTALENARAVQDTDQIRQQIERVKTLMDQQASADRTAQNIQTVLDGGKPEEAALLASAGLQQFGATDDADRLAKLKLQAEALTAARTDDKAAQRTRLRQEAEAAVREKNLRAAAIAYEQALQFGDDDDLRRQLDGVRATLNRYDDCRRRAAELRRDPVNLEEAIANLQQAAQAWDTVQVRQEMDEYALALQKRRDRLSVADFEVRGDIGMPMAGRTVAEVLLPAFKTRYDPVERSQISKVIQELNLEASELSGNSAGRQELGRLAKVRYLVLGSLTVTSGISVNARLVDVRSGLVVQTACLVAVSPDDLMAQLPRLANLLMMTDEQKMVYEQQLAQQAVAAPPAVMVVAPLPPPPVFVVNQPPPPPIVAFTTRPPDLGGLRPQDFDALPPPTTSIEVIVQRDEPYKQRTIQVAVELGDSLFRRGRYREAHVQFELALGLSPHHKEIALRVESCRPHLPPPPAPPVLIQPTPVVVVAPPTVVVPIARPRIAVLNFVVDAAPGLVPPAFGDWAAEQIASYFAPSYEVIERGEVCWYMGRLGVTMRDVLMNPSARICLGRALNVRFFVFGAIQQTASFDVSTHLIDAESGVKQGVGKIHVQDHQELKLRAGELVQQVQANPADANRLQQEAKEKEKVLNEARKLFTAGQYPQTVSFCQEGLKHFPDHVGLQTVKQQAEQALQQAMQEQKRQQELAAQRAQAAALQKRQQELAQEAEAARKHADAAAAARTEAQRQAQEAQKQKASNELYAAGHRALQQGNYPQAVQMLQSAVALKPTDMAVRELAQARAKVDEQAQSQAAREKARREVEAKHQKEAELVRARAQVEEARQKREAEELARRKAQAAALAEKSKKAEEQQRLAEFQRLMKEGNAALAARQFDSAVKTFTQATKVLPGSVEAQTALSRAEQARDQNLAFIRQQEEADKAAKAATAKKAADDAARAATAKKAADDAARAATAKKAADDAARAATAKKVADDMAKAAQVKQLLSAGRTALSARQFDAAAKAFTDAGKLAPGDPELAKALQDLDQARRAAAVADAEQKKRMEADAKNRQAAYQAAMNAGRQALTAKQFDDAVRSVSEAGRLQPGDPAAAALLKDVDKTRKAEYARLMPLGKAAMTAKKFEEAVKTFTDALRAQPGDPAATAALKEAQQALQGSKPIPKK